jgi:hypothetical protein
MSRRLNTAIDAIAFVVFFFAAQPERTGALGHERLGLAATATLIVHLVMHRAWVASVVRRFLGTVARASRVNLLVDALMAVSAVTLAATGVALSRTLLSPFGIIAAHGGSVLELHEGAAEILATLVIAHLALHRAWITRVVRGGLAAVFRPVLAPFARLRAGQPVLRPQIAPAQERSRGATARVRA